MLQAYNMSSSYKATFDGDLIEAMEACHDRICDMLWSSEAAEQHAAIWSLAWLGDCDSLPTRLHRWINAEDKEPLPQDCDIIGRLAELAIHSAHAWTKRFAAWAISTMPLVIKGRGYFCAKLTEADVISRQSLEQSLDSANRELASLIVAWYRQKPNTDEELRMRAIPLLKEANDMHDPTLKRRIEELLNELGTGS